MEPRDFCYWLQGYFEVQDPTTISEEQVKKIKAHLNLVFHHSLDKQYKEGDGSQEVHDGEVPDPLDVGPTKTKFKRPDPMKTMIRC